jgi:phosphatidylglycerol---prolipoprotein diacylglyceryl transferase
MHPILFELGDWPVYAYGVLLAISYLAALQFAVIRARRQGLDGTKIMDLGIYLIIAALVGAKLMLVIVDFDYFLSQPRELLSLVRAGGVFYGGLLAALAVALVLVRRYGLTMWTTADLFAPGIALGHVIGRLGCLLAGCCYGRPTSMPWGVTFTNPVAFANVGTPLNQALHPTQLYDAGAELLILALLLATERKGRPFAGRTFWLYIALYGVSRFVIEFYRGDDRGMIMGLSTSQFVSVLMVPFAVVMLSRLRSTIPGARCRSTAPTGTPVVGWTCSSPRTSKACRVRAHTNSSRTGPSPSTAVRASPARP